MVSFKIETKPTTIKSNPELGSEGNKYYIFKKFYVGVFNQKSFLCRRYYGITFDIRGKKKYFIILAWPRFLDSIFDPKFEQKNGG